MVTVRRRGRDAAWFDGDCRIPFELRRSAYHRWCRNRSVVIGIYSAKHEELLINSMRLRRLVTMQIAIGTLMIVPLPMPGGVHQKVMCLVRSLIFLPFVHLVVHLFLIRRGRLSYWVPGLTTNSHKTLLSCSRPVTLSLHSVALSSEHVRLRIIISS